MNAAREKVEREGGCRVCGAPARQCDAAHLWNRSQGARGFDDPDLTLPLCSKIKGAERGCHDLYDAHRLDLLPYLTLEEELALVRAAKPSTGRGSGIERARTRAIGAGQASRSTGDEGAFGGF